MFGKDKIALHDRMADNKRECKNGGKVNSALLPRKTPSFRNVPVSLLGGGQVPFVRVFCSGSHNSSSKKKNKCLNVSHGKDVSLASYI